MSVGILMGELSWDFFTVDMSRGTGRAISMLDYKSLRVVIRVILVNTQTDIQTAFERLSSAS